MPALDGLRALSVVCVILFHQTIPGFSLGWSGVFLFFVLSGFLITGILLDSKHNSYFLKNFYFRRALRIFPIYYLTLICVFAVSYFKSNLPPVNWFLFVFYFQNYAQGSSSFSLPPPTLNHTWTLAVEQQFYLLWPLFIWIFSKRALLLICFTVICTAPLIRFYLLAKTGILALAFTPLPCVADALCMGSFLAILYRSRLSIQVINWGSLLIFLFLSAALVYVIFSHGINKFWNPSDYLGPNKSVLFYSMLSAAFVCLIALSISGVIPWLTQFLSLSPLRAVGKVSYGAYLYHWPILLWTEGCPLVFGSVHIPVWILQWVLIAFSSTCSYFLIEKPLLAIKKRFQ